MILELDYPGFFLQNVEGLQVLLSAIHKGLQEVFPIEVLYRTWTNTEGQVCIPNLISESNLGKSHLQKRLLLSN